MKIWKYVFDAHHVLDEYNFAFEMPANAQVLSVGVQDSGVVMWALVNPDATLSTRTFAVYMTGYSTIPYDLRHRFVGTCQLPDGIVAHVFELVGV